MRIPVYDPTWAFGARERELLLDAFDSGHISGSSGKYIAQFEERFAAYCGVRYGVAVSSGSTALHLAMVVAGIERGDEVLVSALTNIATANAVVQCGGVVVPIDSEPETWNMDRLLVKRALTKRTKAVVAVHIYGHPVVDFDALADYCDGDDSLFLIEDAAEAHGATYWGGKVGSLGGMACFSFYANKVITTGEGGMVVTGREDFADGLRSLRNLAFTTPRFLHHEVGFNYRMTNMQAAIGCAQLERIEDIIAAKRLLARRYTERLCDIPGLQLPTEKPWARNVYWMYCIVVDPAVFGCTRDDLTARLAAAGVETRTMFCPLNLQPALKGHMVPTSCPVAERLWREGCYLPSTPTLSNSQLDYICDIIRRAQR